MNKCPHCGATLKTLTRVCEACGSEIKPEATASSESSIRTPAAVSAADLSTRINESLSLLKSRPATATIKAFIIGLLTVPSFGLAYVMVKFFTMIGHIGRSPERVKLSLDQDLRAAETSYKSDPEMRALVEKGRSELKGYLNSQHEARMALIYGIMAAVILCIGTGVLIQHLGKVAAQKTAAEAQLQIQQAASDRQESVRRASSLLGHSSEKNPSSGQPNALVVAFTREPKVGIQQIKVLEDLIAARVSNLGFTTISREVAVDSIAKASKGSDAGMTQDEKSLYERFASGISKPEEVVKMLTDQLAEENSVAHLAQVIKTDLIILVALDSYTSKKNVFKGNELAPVATTTIFNNLVVSYTLAYAATGASALGDSIRVTRTIGDTGNLSSESDGIPNDMIDEAATGIAKKITAVIKK